MFVIYSQILKSFPPVLFHIRIFCILCNHSIASTSASDTPSSTYCTIFLLTLLFIGLSIIISYNGLDLIKKPPNIKARTQFLPDQVLFFLYNRSQFYYITLLVIIKLRPISRVAAPAVNTKTAVVKWSDQNGKILRDIDDAPVKAFAGYFSTKGPLILQFIKSHFQI